MSLAQLMQKQDKLVIGLMSGTSADAVDAVLVQITGHGLDTVVRQRAYVTVPFDDAVREEILRVARGDYGGTYTICMLQEVLGQLYLEACEAVCAKAGIAATAVDLIGCHGQTVYHQPLAEQYLGRSVASTLQIGDVSPICEKLHTIVVSDFRVRDVAAGGQGAPLVPYSEYLIYRSKTQNIALQNIGGIGNITFLPANGAMGDTIAFDTGPGNMLMDGMIAKMTGGKQRWDEGGKTAAKYDWDEALLDFLMQDAYLAQCPPKTTGRERYTEAFLATVLQQAAALGLADGQVLRTLTRYTAKTIAFSARQYLPALPDRLIVGGGGSYNETLLHDIAEYLPKTEVLTNEQIGFDGDAKEAVAFAVLANETIHGGCNNVPSATGAAHPVIMGKISQ